MPFGPTSTACGWCSPLTVDSTAPVGDMTTISSSLLSATITRPVWSTATPSGVSSVLLAVQFFTHVKPVAGL